MSEDRLERALQEMKEDDVDAGTLESARGRVWNKLTDAGSATCAEFRQDLSAYLRKELGASRQLLVADHLSRCAQCRARLAEMKGERPIAAMPQRSSSRWVRWAALTAAAAVLFAVLYIGRDAIDGMLAPGGPRATVVSANGGVYRLTVGSLEAGAAIGDRESVRTGPGAHAVLRLADGLTVDVNERTELFVTAAWSGQTIHLQRGDIIVKAAKQRRGRLRVFTRDSIASVKGTVFAVSAGLGGSVVSVVEGSVAVNQPGREVLLRPGQQAASIPALASSVASAVSWSPEAESYLALLASFVKIERELASLPRALRTNATLLCVPSRGNGRLRRGAKSWRHDRPGPDPRRRPVSAERGVRGLVAVRHRTAVEADGGPPPVGEPAARGGDRLLCQLPWIQGRAHTGRAGPCPARQAGGAHERPARALR